MILVLSAGGQPISRWWQQMIIGQHRNGDMSLSLTSFELKLDDVSAEGVLGSYWEEEQISDLERSDIKTKK